MTKLIKALVALIALLAVISGAYLVFSHSKTNSVVLENKTTENQTKNEIFNYELKTPVSYRVWTGSEGSLYYYGNEDHIALAAEIFPFTFDEEAAYLRTYFERSIQETPVTIGSRSGLKISGVLKSSERIRWYGSATSSDSEKTEFVIFPLADEGTLRITVVRHLNDLDTFLSGLAFNDKPFVPFAHDYKTYANTDYGFEFIYPTNTFKNGLGRPALHTFTNADGRTSISFGADQADPIFYLTILNSLNDDKQYNVKLKKGDYTYRMINGSKYIEMEFPGYDDGGGNAIYIPHNGYVLRVSTEGYGTFSQGETGKRIAEGILETIRFTR